MRPEQTRVSPHDWDAHQYYLANSFPMRAGGLCSRRTTRQPYLWCRRRSSFQLVGRSLSCRQPLSPGAQPRHFQADRMVSPLRYPRANCQWTNSPTNSTAPGRSSMPMKLQASRAACDVEISNKSITFLIQSSPDSDATHISLLTFFMTKASRSGLRAPFVESFNG